ncbi:MAG: hypothetical protein Q8Q63_09995 [Phaeovulum sp.]|uniref:hypothetical protein n=1 Tax=Phaeovulum sp. TaxID=2934796 RepID=UPI0027311BF1|nr:hypothetical protein [Phaeovulum sp.]MDP2062487.1 hypothetical protein [Phaeovulum sp.]MDP3861898.1 hypothetical protein [Phaeovulum sp.]
MSKSHDAKRGPQGGHSEEELLEVRGDLPRLAWAIGARLASCQFAEGRLIVLRDPAIEAALAGLGAALHPFRGCFAPDTATSAGDIGTRHARRHVQFHVARMHGDDGTDEDAADAEAGPPASNA